MEDWQEYIKKEISTYDVVLFMKGTKNLPACGFSAQVVHILTRLNVAFKDINILENTALREAIKRFTEWPTLPQLYIKGEFVGGCDIVREMFETGELAEHLSKLGVAFSPPSV